MNARTYLIFLLLATGPAARLPAQEAPGIRLHGAVAAITGSCGNGSTIRATSQGAEPAAVGGALAGSYILASGCRIPDQLDRLLQYVLSPGWQLLGAPGTSDRTTGEIFVGARGYSIKIGSIFYYNHDTLRYALSGDDSPILPRQGFWLFSYWGGESQSFVARPGIAARDWLQEIPFRKWVLYSPPGKIIMGDMAGLSIQAWDTQAQAYRHLGTGDTIEPPNGYWVYRTVMND